MPPEPSENDPAATTTLSRTAADDLVPTAAERSKPRAFDLDPIIAWAATLAITLVAAFLRMRDLGNPRALLFDETYYAKHAWSLVHNGYAQSYVDNADQRILAGNLDGLWKGSTPDMIVHPEVGKWLIGLSEATIGMTPAGWRFAPALVGALMVFVMIRLTRRVTGSTMLGLVAGVLMTFDGLQFVLSRLALLDIFQAFFVLSAVSCMVADRDWFRRRLDATSDHEAIGDFRRDDPGSTDWYRFRGPWGPRVLWRPWLLAASLWWGLALGTKWSTLYLMAAFGLLYWFWNAGARRMFGVAQPIRKAAIADALPGLLYLVLVPVVIYIASWTGWLMHANVYEQRFGDNPLYGPAWGSYWKKDAQGFFPELFQSLHSLWNYHRALWDFHTEGLKDATHRYASNPLGWTVLNRPVGVDAQNGILPGEQGCTAAADSTCLRQILLIGTPALWWFGTCALVYSLVAWIGRRDWRYGLVVVGALAAWLPWLRFADRPIFSFYAIVIEPFLILGTVMVLGEILGRADASAIRRRTGAIIAGTVVVAVVVNFAWFWPIYTDGLLTRTEWLERIWFRHWI